MTVTAAASGGTAEIEAHALDLGESDRFAADGRTPGNERDGWRAFVRGVVGELDAAGIELPGAQVEISSDLPRGAGLGSSAALSVALCLALLELAGEPAALDRLVLARLCARVENDWVGAPTGLLDQLATLYGEPGQALRLDMRALAVEPVALDLHGWTLATLPSGDERGVAESGYAERRAECERACAELGVESLREATREAADKLPPPLNRRAHHVSDENLRVDAMVAALSAGDLEAAAALLDASHAGLRDDFEVSTPAVEATIERARAAGARGARIHGGGFGGQVLALFPAGANPPDDATEVTPSGGARVL